ncbi:Neuroparsin 2 [Frankliniella occidentalis]|uniref:Neuroparsin-A-like n=1 Tax=Frankliniella occidentalis TaxID=133901 RepID=A0A6J1RT40_FRAOC|nr:neuroparsin-A-like [Frankliniella occidentalis]KAE8750077.1 Neuroparsin 2 [Frankliniella occidentalis]
MPAPQLTIHCWLIVLIVGILLQQALRSDAFTLCKTNARADNCAHGLTTDYCGNTVCAKGPGERCGGPSNVLGQCGEGMHCKCEVCSGCSIETVECHFAKATCF